MTKLNKLLPDPLGITKKMPDPLGILNIELPGTEGKSTILPEFPDISMMLPFEKEKTTDELQQKRQMFEKNFSADRVSPSLQSKGVPHGEYSY